MSTVKKPGTLKVKSAVARMPAKVALPPANRAAIEHSLSVGMGRALHVHLRRLTRKGLTAEMTVNEDHINRSGRINGGIIMSFADVLGAIGTVANLPEGYRTTTLESKTNFFAAGEGDNIPPMQDLPVYCIDAGHGPRLTLMRWGLVPAWAKEPDKGAPLNNARAETVAAKPSFREAYRQRRCLVPMNGFYEWQRSDVQKTPFYFQMRDAELFAVAGLYEYWPGNATAPPMTTFTMLTTSANALMQPIHDRMPVIIAPGAYDAWLDPRNNGRGLEPLLQPFAPAAMRAHVVSPRVNSVRNDDAALMEAATASAILDPAPIQGQLL